MYLSVHVLRGAGVSKTVLFRGPYTGRVPERPWPLSFKSVFFVLWGWAWNLFRFHYDLPMNMFPDLFLLFWSHLGGKFVLPL